MGLTKLLNRAARYFPILRELRQHHATERVLDVGSGPIGIGEFWPHPFVGCDVTFPGNPQRPMMPVMCSAAGLPFRDRSFDAVIASDVMEHVPPEKRPEVIAEILRVADKIAVFGYPCGTAARELDQRLRRHYVSRSMSPPIWLEEHMLYPFPTEDLFRSVRQGWKMKIIPNESLNFHYWMMRREMLPSLNRLFRASLALAPHLIEYLLRTMDRLPSYRKIFVLVRTEPTT